MAYRPSNKLMIKPIQKPSFYAVLLCGSILFQACDAAEPCSVRSAVGLLEAENLQQLERSTQVETRLLSQMRIIVSKVSDPKKTLASQLSPSELDEFESIRARQIELGFNKLIEGDHDRDAEVVSLLVDEANKIYANPAYVPATDNLSAEIIVNLRSINPVPKVTEDTFLNGDCTIDKALFETLNGVLSDFARNGESAIRSISLLAVLKQQYGIKGGDILSANLSADDRREAERAIADAKWGTQTQLFIYDLANIRLWWTTAQLVFEDRKRDTETYGYDAASIDRTLRENQKQYSDLEKKLIALWYIVDEKKPSWEAKQASETADLLSRIQKSDSASH